MKLTNKLGLPQVIVDAVANDPYVGGGDISVTKLIAPAYQRKLMQERWDDLEEDVADRIWALLGQIGHGIVERIPSGPHVLKEERLYMTVNGKEVSGQFDHIVDGILTDYKFTAVWTVKGEAKQEWTAQLNLLRLLAHHKWKATGDERYRVDCLQIIAFLRDWKYALLETKDYPKHQIAVVPIDVWTLEETYDYLCERLDAHFGDTTPPCSDEERWKTDDEFAVMKNGNKRATKVYTIRAEAEAAVESAGKGYYMLHRPGSYLRCERYCPVARVCPVLQQERNDAPF